MLISIVGLVLNLYKTKEVPVRFHSTILQTHKLPKRSIAVFRNKQGNFQLSKNRVWCIKQWKWSSNFHYGRAIHNVF